MLSCRATLAEKELSALKEKYAASDNSKTEGQLPQNALTSTEHNSTESNPRRSPSNLDQELQAKDKEFPLMFYEQYIFKNL
ncbi:hypothetical protein KQX54_002859 [Cotesia glomerata]|uniref:Uncharacterized protein n=1 Tax=Cotesia glomerata TaxID=32391 RepID=A0AAV7IPB6_COTGL|nr:hypothetical protein KQX54_002859 [Cotesia glomerata]